MREGTAMLDACRDPDLVVEITLQPVRRYGVDAAIFFSDIVVPLKAVGVDLDIEPGVGPVIADPIRDAADVDRLRPLAPDDVPYVTEAVRRAHRRAGRHPADRLRRRAVHARVATSSRAGPSKTHDRTKAMMYGEPELWHGCSGSLADIAVAYLQVQVEAGASAVQLFDSWVGGAHARRTTAASVLPHVSRMLRGAGGLGVPRIHFGVGTGELLGLMGEAGADVVGVDWRVPLDDAVAPRRAGKAVQGNLDPSLLLAPWRGRSPSAPATSSTRAAAEPGHVFNLGHGVLPGTDPDVLARLTDFVHEESEGR